MPILITCYYVRRKRHRELFFSMSTKEGVLDSLRYFKSKKYKSEKADHDYDMSNMINRQNLFWVSLLCRITKAKVVLSSTWKYGFNEDGTPKEMEKGHNMFKTNDLFKKYGINIISITRKGELVPPDWELDLDNLSKWCDGRKFSGLEDCKEKDFILKYCRGTQIAEWIERNNYKGNYIVVDDDVGDIVFYKDLKKRLVQTSYYKRYDGFRFLHFVKGLWLLK